jgi:phosphatidylinositol alpha-mannosyltransferase
VKRNRLPDVVFTGQVSDEDQPRYYRTADVFCAPNTGHESFGLILVEAMASGRPIVATNIPGFSTVVTDGREGFLVPPMDERPLANALLQLLNDRKRREEMGKNGRATALKYDWQDISQRVLEYYDKTIHKVQSSGS